jgi:two-component system, cell cycle response regulator DivK
MSKIHILLVEDNQDNQDLMRFLLERSGYVVTAAVNGFEGIEFARREMPDVVVMDLSMPELDGWTAARRMKADPQLKSIPLIAVTAHAFPYDRRKALDSGFDNYLSKPINIHLFDATVIQAIEQRTQLSH